MRRAAVAWLTIPIAVAVLCGNEPAAHASDGPTLEPAEQPRVLEWLNLELGMAPASISMWFGAHTWLGNKYLVGLRAGGRQTIIERDLDGDGTIDFAKGKNNNPLQFEVQADLAVPLWSWHGQRLYPGGLRKIVTTPSGTRTIWTGGTLVPDVTELSFATGARLAVGGDELQLGLPLGVRYSYRTLDRGDRFREWWASARALVFVPSFKPGLDLELAYMLGRFGISAWFEYFPRIHAPDPAGPTCQPFPQRCTPATPLTAFNRIPNEGMLVGGLRLRLTYSF